MPQPPQEVFKPQRGSQDKRLPCTEKGFCNFHRGPRQSDPTKPQGWARTGLEPEVTIFLRDSPVDALIDMNSNYFMTDPRLCKYLCLDVTPFLYELPLCMGC